MKQAGRILVVVLGCLAVFVLYLLSGAGTHETRIEYTVDARDPESGILHVTMIIRPPVRPFLTFWLRDVNQAGLQRVEGFSASRGGKALLNWQTLPASRDTRSVWTGFSREPLEIRYDLNPLWIKGQSHKAFLGPDFGYFKGEIFLYSLLAVRGLPGMLFRDNPGDLAGQVQVRFLLPDGWTLLSPWGSGRLEMLMGQTRAAYYGIGPMSVTTAKAGDSTLLLGLYTGLDPAEKAGFLQDIPALFEAIGKTTGLPAGSQAPYFALTVLPGEAIGGGSSGINSLVTCNQIDTISHEMFHWWNGDAVETKPDATWVGEGFTKYYAGKMLYTTGIWSLDEFHGYLETFYEEIELGADGRPLPIDLVGASETLTKRGGNDEYYDVYNGGALVANFLDQELAGQGKSLDQIWSMLGSIGRPITTGLFLEQLEKLGGAELAKTCEELVYGRRALPREPVDAILRRGMDC